MKVSRALCALALALLFTGCCSVAVTKDPRLNMVEVRNQVCYLFYFIPMCSGDPDYPNDQVSNWWENTVNLKTNMRLLDEAAADAGATGYRNITSHLESESILFLLFKRCTLHTSAQLIKD